MTGLEIVLEYLPIKIKKIINEQKSTILGTKQNRSQMRSEQNRTGPKCAVNKTEPVQNAQNVQRRSEKNDKFIFNKKQIKK